MGEKIYSAINAIMADIGAIGKDKKNVQQNFMYRGVDDVMNALNPAFIKHKVFTVPQVLAQKREDRTSIKGNALIYSVCTVKYTFYADDGSNVEVITIGEGMDSGDKATNKAMATAFKYACFQLFCIPTEEMSDKNADANPVDPDGESHTTKPIPKITEAQINTLFMELKRTGIGLKGLLKKYNLSDIHKMNTNHFKDAMDILKQKPDKPTDPDPGTVPPDDSGLPFN